MEFIKFTNPFGATLTLGLPKTAQTEPTDKPEVSKGEDSKAKAMDNVALIKLMTGPAASIAKLQNELRDVVEAISDPALKEKLAKHIESIGAAGKDLLEEAVKALGTSAPAAIPTLPNPAATLTPPPIAGDLSVGDLSPKAPIAPTAPAAK